MCGRGHLWGGRLPGTGLPHLGFDAAGGCGVIWHRLHLHLVHGQPAGVHRVHVPSVDAAGRDVMRVLARARCSALDASLQARSAGGACSVLPTAINGQSFRRALKRRTKRDLLRRTWRGMCVRCRVRCRVRFGRCAGGARDDEEGGGSAVWFVSAGGVLFPTLDI